MGQEELGDEEGWKASVCEAWGISGPRWALISTLLAAFIIIDAPLAEDHGLLKTGKVQCKFFYSCGNPNPPTSAVPSQ
jgi:hypothetical protein